MKKREILKTIFADKSNCVTVITALILFALLEIYIFKYLGYNSFWGDELYTISFIKTGRSLKDMLYIFITDETTNPPLYDIFLYFWYRLVPHTERWMLLPNMVFYMIGLFYLIRFIYRVTGSIEGAMVMLIVAAFNSVTLRYLITELRSYTLLFMFSSITLFYYYQNRKSESIYRTIALGFIMMCMSMTHYFGAVTMAAYAFLDLILYIKKKIALRNIVTYLIVALVIVPYLGIVMANSTRDLSVFLSGKNLGIKEILFVIKDLIGNKYICIVYIAFFITWIASLRKDDIIKTEARKAMLLLLWAILFTFTSTFVYSKWINPKGSIFRDHYFTSVWPHVCAVIGITYLSVLNLIKKSGLYKRVGHICEAAIIVTIAILTVASKGSRENYEFSLHLIPAARNAANYIQRNVEENDGSLVILTQQFSYPQDGWEEFYFDKHYNFVSCLGDDGEIDKEILKKEIPQYEQIYYYYLWNSMIDKDRGENREERANIDVMTCLNDYELIYRVDDAYLDVYKKKAGK